MWYLFLFLTITISITPMSSGYEPDEEDDVEAQRRQITPVSRAHSESDLGILKKSSKGKEKANEWPILSRTVSEPDLEIGSINVTELQNLACTIVLGAAQDSPTAHAFKKKIGQLNQEGDPQIHTLKELSDDESKKQQLEQLVQTLFAQTLQEHQEAQQKRVKHAKIWSCGSVGIAAIPVILALWQLFAAIGVGVGCNT